MALVNYIRGMFREKSNQDLSRHRVYTARYEDLCM